MPVASHLDVALELEPDLEQGRWAKVLFTSGSRTSPSSQPLSARDSLPISDYNTS